MDWDCAFDGLIEKIQKYNPQADVALLKKAFTWACNAHKNQMRNSGEPYIVHPLEVANILADIELDTESIVAGLLHDVIEDTNVSFEEIKQEFGEEIANLVEGVTKLDNIKYTTREETQIENLRKMFLAMAKDIRVILIKLADRLHNMRTLKSMPPEKQLEKARETLEVYAPLAHRLGISKIKWELEDLSLKYLDSVAYYEIAEGINKKQKERLAYIESIIEVLQKKLAEINIKANISGRPKHFYSIFRKMYTQNKTLDEIYDLFAVRIIVDTVNDCYAVLGLVHELYKPMPGRFKDYIAMPKPNMYQSLHTTVIGTDGQPFEIQIRTWEMHQVAEYGVAAHWKYKEGKTSKTDLDQKLAWVRQLLEIQKDVTDTEEFMQTLKIDLFADEVFVFTPKGDVINLPSGATPVDFAFAIHSAVGYRMIGAKVNSKIVPLDYTLQNGDIVEILTSATTHGPSMDWLKIVKTSQARNKINAWFKKEYREENILKGKDAFEKECKREALNPATLLKPEYLEPALKRYGFNNLDDMYAAIGYGGLTAHKVVTRLREIWKESTKTQEEQVPQVQEPKKKKNYHGGVVVKGVDNVLVRLSRCCNPVPGDEIVGFITKGRGVSVHRADCVNIAPEALTDEMKNRIIECTWADEQKQVYLSDLQIEASDRTGLLAEITNAISDMKIPLVAISARTNKEKLAFINITLEISDITQMEMVIKRLHRVPGILEITRSRN